MTTATETPTTQTSTEAPARKFEQSLYEYLNEPHPETPLKLDPMLDIPGYIEITEDENHGRLVFEDVFPGPSNHFTDEMLYEYIKNSLLEHIQESSREETIEAAHVLAVAGKSSSKPDHTNC
jgi:hypothetical protein